LPETKFHFALAEPDSDVFFGIVIYGMVR